MEVVLEVDTTQEDFGLHYLHKTAAKQYTARTEDSPKSEQTHNSALRYGFGGKDVPLSLRHGTCFFYLTIVGWDRIGEAYHNA